MTTDTDGARMAAHLMRITDAATALAAEAQRQVNQHAFANDALRAENQSLRIVAHNLRTQRDEDVARISALEAELARLQHLVDESRKVHEANARDVDAKPVREVVRGLLNGTYPQMVPPEFAKHANWSRPPCFSASFVGGVWIAYEDGADFPKRHGLTESEAIAWVLDGVLPDESRKAHEATTP